MKGNGIRVRSFRFIIIRTPNVPLVALLNPLQPFFICLLLKRPILPSSFLGYNEIKA